MCGVGCTLFCFCCFPYFSSCAEPGSKFPIHPASAQRRCFCHNSCSEPQSFTDTRSLPCSCDIVPVLPACTGPEQAVSGRAPQGWWFGILGLRFMNWNIWIRLSNAPRPGAAAHQPPPPPPFRLVTPPSCKNATQVVALCSTLSLPTSHTADYKGFSCVSTQGPSWGFVREGPSSGTLSLAPVSAKELKERAFQGVP